jgi:RNA polymerase sigma-70 factor (ECF subfamily)
MAATTAPSNVWYVQDLVRRAQARDEPALGEIYERYAPRIHSYLVHRLNGRTHEAEDLTAEVFLKAFEKMGSYEDRGAPFSAWLYRIAHNSLVDYVRRRPNQPTASLENAVEVQEPLSLRELHSGLTVEQVRGALDLLTDEQRQVVSLRFLEGKSTLEVAEVTGKSEEAVKKLQSRGLASLKRVLDCKSGCWRVGLDAVS